MLYIATLYVIGEIGVAGGRLLFPYETVLVGLIQVLCRPVSTAFGSMRRDVFFDVGP